MAKYVCVKNYVSINGNVNFKKDDVFEINPDGTRYLLNITDTTYCLITSNTFIKFFKPVFKFGR